MVSYLTIIKRHLKFEIHPNSFGMVSYLTIIKRKGEYKMTREQFWYGVIFNYY